MGSAAPGSFSFRVSQPALTNKGRADGDANPLTHEPHVPRHTRAGTRAEKTFVPPGW